MAINERSGATVVLLVGYRYSGRSLALQRLELAGYTCVDNLPPALLPGYLDHGASADRIGRIAVALDTEGPGGPAETTLLLDRMENEGKRPCLVFIEAGDSVLAERRSSGDELAAPEGEGMPLSPREAMAPIRARADLVLDSSWMSPLEERDRIIAAAEGRSRDVRPTVEIMSFGFKHGAPAGDVSIDVRFIPNPYYVSALRPLSGLDRACSGYVLGHESASATVEALRSLVRTMLPAYAAQGRHVLKVRIGCTGGQHRSVAVAEALRAALAADGVPCSVRHREIEAGRHRAGGAPAP
ncbi:MAG: hypothetical protein KKA67_06680 [Spirochaetes bacterium]|nr:hypothetical protein [Spirochaetota bacterium]MBU1080616.1 hypothetical protein [Spirochaetota bacterium]